MAPPAVQGPALVTEPEAPVFREARLEGNAQAQSTLPNIASKAARSSFVHDDILAHDWLEDVQKTLYRQPELEQRLRTLMQEERGATQRRTFALVSGPSGTGRRFCVQQTLATLAQESNGFVIIGKFDAIFQPVPYGAFLMCVAQYIYLVKQQGPAAVAQFRALVETHVGQQNVAVLRSWLPSLDLIMGPWSAEEAATHGGGTDRFARALKLLRKAMSLMGRPTYTLLENIQFADQASLDLLVDILRFPPKCGGFVVATCDSGVAPDSLVAVKLREIENNVRLQIVNIQTRAVSEENLFEALADTDLNQDERQKLARITLQRSGGDVFLSSLFLRWVHNKRILSRDWISGSVVVDEDEIEVSLGHKTCQELLRDELAALPGQARETLKVASCLGHIIDLRFLSCVLDQVTEEVESTLRSMEKRGLVNRCDLLDAYCFSHDCVQQAAFELIPKNEKPLFRVEIGRRIWRKLPVDELDTLFTIIEQLQEGKELIRREKERVAVAQLCLYAGERAAASSSFARSLSVLEFGVYLLLDEDCWKKEYDLILSLCSSTIEMQFYNSRFDDMDKLIDYTLSHARTLNDKMRAYTCKVSSLSLRGQPAKCVDVGIEVLSLLGYHANKMTCRFHILKEYRQIRKLLREKSDEALLRLPKMTNRQSVEAMRILSLMMFPAMSTKSAIAPLTMLLLMKLTLTEGHSVFSPIAFVSYGMLCTSPVHNDLDEAFRFGQLALKLHQQESRIEYMPRVFVTYFGFIHGWKMPVRESLVPLLQAHKVGIETGDLEFASISIVLYCMNSIETGQPLNEISAKADALLEDLASRQHEGLTMMASPFIQYLRRLTGAEGQVCMNGLIRKAREAKFAKGECIGGLWKMRIAYIFNDFEEAGRLMEETDWSSLLTAPQYALIAIGYVVAMISCSNIRIGRNVKYHKYKVKKIMKKFSQWARSCPHECSGKYALIEAEWASIHGKREVAREKYTNAILLAKGTENDYEVATAHERAMHHYRSISANCVAQDHGEQAYEYYLKWGATAKAAHLRKFLDSVPSARQIVTISEAVANGQCFTCT